MNKVRYIPEDYSYSRLTPYRVYDIIAYSNVINTDNITETIIIVNDDGYQEHFYTHTDEGILEFIDATQEYRNNVIEGILK